MTVLAIDTSTRGRAVVLRTTASGEVLDERVPAGEALDLALPSAIAALLDSGLEAVVVLTGPGSYTGVRAGMAAALGIATARGVALHGAGTLEAVAAASPRLRDDVVAVADAGRGGVYVAWFARRGPAMVMARGPLRMEAADVGGGDPRPVATALITGLDVHVIPGRAALAAAVPLALSRRPLDAVGLASTTAASPDQSAPR